MSEFKFGRRSSAELMTVNYPLQKVLNRAIRITPIDFSILKGRRSQAEQDRLYAQGRTQPYPVVTWTRESKHITGDAFDVAPYPLDWNDTEGFIMLAGVILAAAKLEGVKLKWGGSWKSRDLPHFELDTGAS